MDTRIFNTTRDYFLEKYQDENNIKYIFTPSDGFALKQILKKIEFLNKNTMEDPFYENNLVIDDFKILINNLPKWYRENGYSLKVINSKFNELISTIKNETKSKYSNDFKQKIINNLNL